VKVSISQFKSTQDVAANLRTVLDHIAQAAAEGARVIAFPEASMVAFESSRDELRMHAESSSKHFVEAVAKAAAVHRLDVFIGVYEPNGEARSSNVFVHANAAGEVAGR